MSKFNHTIILESKPTQRIVKRIALLAFSSLRYNAKSATRIPILLAIAASDVRDAWLETAQRESK